MSKRFNTKIYQNKQRIFRSVLGAVDIQRIWRWDDTKKEYRAPVHGHIFVARRYEKNIQGGQKRVKKTFDSLEEARMWQRKIVDNQNSTAGNMSMASSIALPLNLGPTFQEIYEAFLQKKVSKLGIGTQANYHRYIALYFGSVMSMPIRSITPMFIDKLLDSWRATIGRTYQSRFRISFEHELAVLRSVLRFYGEYYDDPDFRFPLKQRHAVDAVIRKAPPKDKDLTESEFLRFRDELSKQKHGNLLSAMATVQFYHALRVSEVTALRFEDVRLDFANPHLSSLRVCQHVIYPRVGMRRAIIETGFKNAKGGQDSIKEQPLWPGSFKALKTVFKIGCCGLIFGKSATEPLSYRMIQAAYDRAFKRAGFTYRGTHLLRHGGTRRVYNSTGGDIAIAQQLLGNSDMQTTLVYAKRDKTALRTLIQKEWKENAM